MGWTAAARGELLDRRLGCGAWSYRNGLGAAVEPTALAILGLVVPGRDASADVSSAVRGGADWLSERQRADGSLGVSPALPEVGWATPLAVLAWCALGVYPAARRRAVNFLLRSSGLKVAQPGPRERVVGHDTTLLGWSWLKGTHSWVEPTAMAILALSVEGEGGHPRVLEGLRLLVDRAVPGGGWNYGNREVFGRQLRAQPGPTGLALLALAAGKATSPETVVGPAVDFLKAVLPDLRSSVSLGWGVLGLRAWGDCPPEAERWLEESFRLHGRRPDSTAGVALLLAAADPNLLSALGFDSGPERRASDSQTSGIGRHTPGGGKS